MATSSIGIGLGQKQKELPKPLLLKSAALLTLPLETLNEAIEAEIALNPFLDRVEKEPVESISMDSTPFDEPFGLERDFHNETSFLTWKETSKRLEKEAEDADPTEALTYSETLLTHLTRQIELLNLPKEEKELATWIAGNLTDDGLLDGSLELIADSYEKDIPIEKWEKALCDVQDLDPAGVGARTQLEVLILQLNHTPHDETSELRQVAVGILKTAPELLLKGDKKKIAETLSVPIEKVKDAIALLSSLDPRPCARFADLSKSQAVADFSVRKKNGKLVLNFHEDAIAHIAFNEETFTLLKDSGKPIPKDMAQFAREAKLFIQALEQRKKTLTTIVTTLFAKQKAFFTAGPEALIPMSMQELADALLISKSTVSRAVAGKYIETPFGFYPLKFFFSASLTTDNPEAALASVGVRAKIRELVEKEDPKKPLSDSEIAKALEKEGIHVARRTVAKYRELEKIPPKDERRSLVD